MLIFFLFGISKVFATPHASMSDKELPFASQPGQLDSSYVVLKKQLAEKAKAGGRFDQDMYRLYAAMSRLLLQDGNKRIPRAVLVEHEARLRELGRETAECLYIHDIWVLLTDTSPDVQTEPFLKFFLESIDAHAHRDYNRMVHLQNHLNVVLGSSNDSAMTLFCTEYTLTDEPEWSRSNITVETEKAVLADWVQLFNTEDWISALSKIERAYQFLVKYDSCDGHDARRYLAALYACWTQGHKNFVNQLSIEGMMERFDHYFLMYNDDPLKQHYIDFLARGQKEVVDLTLRVHMLRRMLVLSQEVALYNKKNLKLTEEWFDGVCDLALISLDEAQRAECIVFFSYFLMDYFHSHTPFSGGHLDLIGKVVRVAKRMKPSLLQFRFIEDIKRLLQASPPGSAADEAGRLGAFKELEDILEKVKDQVVLLPLLKQETPIVRNFSKHEDLLSLAVPDSDLSANISAFKL